MLRKLRKKKNQNNLHSAFYKSNIMSLPNNLKNHRFKHHLSQLIIHFCNNHQRLTKNRLNLTSLSTQVLAKPWCQSPSLKLPTLQMQAYSNHNKMFLLCLIYLLNSLLKFKHHCFKLTLIALCSFHSHNLKINSIRLNHLNNRIHFSNLEACLLLKIMLCQMKWK